jgi:hypothetical protein
MMTRDAEGIQSSIAVRVSPHDDHGTIQSDVWTFIEGHQSNGHGETSSIEAIGRPAIILSQA